MRSRSANACLRNLGPWPGHTGVVTARRRAFGVCLSTLVFCVSACSGGAGKHSSGPTTTAATTTTVSVSHDVANLASCPATIPLTTLNGGATGLDKKLVPIAALNVRVCRYESTGRRLLGAATLEPLVAATFEDATNRLPTLTGPLPDCPRPPASSPHFFLTFASDSQRVDLDASPACGVVTNGTLSAYEAAKWVSELTGFTANSGGNPAAAVG